MFIREYRTKNRQTKTTYSTHRLVESYWTKKGPRQRIIMHLGTLTIPRKRWKELASMLEARLCGQMSILEEDKDLSQIVDEAVRHNDFVKKSRDEKQEILENADFQAIDINSVGASRFRSLGAELVANEMWEKLGFDDILNKCGFKEKDISLAKAVILGRLIKPDSEPATWNWFQSSTVLIEMTAVDLTGLGKDSFYGIGEHLLSCKNEIEAHLREKEHTFFTTDKKVYLYDLTNTYIEGSGSPKARYGASKEKRYDCPHVALALLVDNFGFPVFSQIYRGNTSEPQTFEAVLKKLETDCRGILGEEKPVLIMDRGIATKANLEEIKRMKYPYAIVSRQQTDKLYKAEFKVVKDLLEGVFEVSEEIIKKITLEAGWTRVKSEDTVFVKKVEHEESSHVLVISINRARKEQGMDMLKEKRFIEDVEKLKASFEKGYITVPEKVWERIGRMKNKYSCMNKYYDINVGVSEDGSKVISITYGKKESRNQRSVLTGSYVIDTSQIEFSAEEVWKQYMVTNRVEDAFKDLKSDLGLCPIHHHIEEHTDAHLFIGVLAYHLMTLIENNLGSRGDNRNWRTIKNILHTHQRCTVIMTGSDKKIYHVRVSGTPESSHNEIYRMLKIKDPLKRKKMPAGSRV